MTDLPTHPLRRLALAGLLALSSWWVGSGCATPSGSVVTGTSAAAANLNAPGRSQPAVAADESATPSIAAEALPEAVAAPVDPLRPEISVNLDDAAAQADLWVRVRRGFRMPDLDTDLVRDRERWYASRPDYVDRMTSRVPSRCTWPM